MMKMRWLLFAMLHALTAMPLHAALNELKTISLRHRFAEELLPMVQPLVGPQGTASGMNNVLIIRTTPDRMAEIEQVVAELDVAHRNIRVEVSHESGLQSDDRRISAGGRGRIGDAEIVIGEPGRRRDGAEVEFNQGSRRIQRSGNQYLTVMDGGDAFIEVGQSVPYSQQWAVFTQRYARIRQAAVFRDITTGFAVSPRYIGDEVEVEITPRIARPGRGDVVDFEALSTRVRVRPGEWFDLGGTMAGSDEVSRAILQSGSGATAETSSLMIRVD
jgi:hypothetical protein